MLHPKRDKLRLPLSSCRRGHHLRCADLLRIAKGWNERGSTSRDAASSEPATGRCAGHIRSKRGLRNDGSTADVLGFSRNETGEDTTNRSTDAADEKTH